MTSQQSYGRGRADGPGPAVPGAEEVITIDGVDQGEHRDRAWLQAALALTRLLVGEVERSEALHTVARRLREVSGADYVAIGLDNPAYPEGTGFFAAVEGLGLEHLADKPTSKQGLSARVVQTGVAVVSPTITLEEGFDPPAEVAGALAVLGLGMYLPLTVAGKVLGVLVAGWRRGSPQERVAAQEVPLVEMFAGHAALVLQQFQARLLVLQERDRIADDLRDVAIERLLAIGTHLHGLAGMVTRPETRQRVSEAIDDLDESTQQIRTAIFALQQERSQDRRSTSLSILDRIDAARAVLGITPRLVVDGLVDRTLPPAVERELVHAVGECLASAATHRPSSSVEVIVRVTAEDVTLRVSDDGQLPPLPHADTDLAQARDRAQRLGGSCTVDTETTAEGPDEVVIAWRVPRTDPRDDRSAPRPGS